MATQWAQLPRGQSYRAAAWATLIICGLMLVIAIFTKPDGRAECANQVLEGSLRSGSDADHPAEGVVFSIASVIALYGSFALVEAAKRIFMQHRLSAIDRDQTARILAQISDAPTGLPWTALLSSGQPASTLRGPVAALILNDWIKLVDGGATLIQRSAAMRRLHRRHPLEDVFNPGE